MPSDLAALLNRKEITKSLDTAVPRVARERAAWLHVLVIEIWAEARAMSKSGTTAEEIRALLTRLLGVLDVAQADARHGHGGRPTMIQIMEAAERDEVGDAALAATSRPGSRP